MKAIIFDRDGTLLDFSDMFLRFIHDIYEQQNVSPESDETILSYAFWDQIVSQEMCIGKIRIRDHLDNIPNKYMHLGKLYPGVAEAVLKLREMGLQMAIVSGWVGTSSTHALIERKGLSGCFDCILTQDDMNGSRLANANNPGSSSVKIWLQEQAMSYLGTRSDEVLVVRDAPDDVMTANHLNLKSVAVMTGNGQKLHSAIAELEPDWIVESVANLPEILAGLQN